MLTKSVKTKSTKRKQFARVIANLKILKHISSNDEYFLSFLSANSVSSMNYRLQECMVSFHLYCELQVQKLILAY